MLLSNLSNIWLLDSFLCNIKKNRKREIKKERITFPKRNCNFSNKNLNKAGSWLGFVQILLWSKLHFNIETVQSHNKMTDCTPVSATVFLRWVSQSLKTRLIPVGPIWFSYSSLESTVPIFTGLKGWLSKDSEIKMPEGFRSSFKNGFLTYCISIMNKYQH